MATGAAMLAVQIGRREKPAPHAIAWLLAGAVAWGVLQQVFATTLYRHATETWTLAWLANLTAFSLARRLARDGAEALLDALLVFGVAVAVVGTVQAFTSPGKVFGLFESGYRDLVMGPFVYHNQYAAFVELLLPVALARSLFDTRQRLIFALAAAFLYASVIASGSRAGALLVTAEVVALVAMAGWKDRRAALGPLALVAVAMAVSVMALGPDTLQRRLGAGFSGGRIEYWKASAAMLADHPLAGVGLGNWPLAYPRYATADDGLIANQAHSEWVEWSCEGGLPFLAILLAIAALSAKPAIASRWGLGIIAFWLHCAVDYPTRRPAIAVFFFAFLGLVTVWRRMGQTRTGDEVT
ncbi:MAG: O-antigen ligase family protein [Bryobacteraceae bacterium]